MIIYIHGFASSGQGTKAQAFRKYYASKNESFIAPSLSYIPELAISTLEELILSYDEEVKLIGSSLGGYYAMYLADKYKLKAILINPSIYPYKTLVASQGEMTHYHDGSHFSWQAQHFNMLKNYEVSVLHDNVMLLLQKGDKTLNYQEALEKLPNTQMIIEEGGNHSFEGIERYFDKINEF